MLSPEVWKPLVGFETRYEVSSHGRFRSIWNGRCRMLRPYVDRDGYHTTRLCVDNQRRSVKLHHCVLLTFVGPRPEGAECRHLDGNPGNNHVDNLAWGSSSENAADRVRHGTAYSFFRDGPKEPIKCLQTSEV